MSRIYRFEPDTLIRLFPVQMARLSEAEQVAAGLVSRYDLRGKSVMAIGSGIAVEEVAMLRCGAQRFYLFDIDEQNRIRPPLDATGEAYADPHASIHYYFGDFRETKRSDIDIPRIDVLYMSGFTPDEQHRGAVSAMATKRTVELWAEGESTEGRDPNWPAGVSPLTDSVIAAINDYLSPGGLLIIQSIGYGVDVRSNPGYVEEWRRCLAAQDVELLEGYCFVASPGVTFWVGVKGRAGADAWRQTLGTRPELTRFHYRTGLGDRSIMRFT